MAGESNESSSEREKPKFVPALQEGEGQPEAWKLKYLYDGGCSVCNGLVRMLIGRRGSEGIWFENIASRDYTPSANAGIHVEEAMKTIHVIKRDSDEVVLGMDALSLLYGQVGLGWVFSLTKIPVLGQAADLLYKLVSKNRTALAGSLDAAMMAVDRIKKEERGEGSCAEGSECREAYNTPQLEEDAPVKSSRTSASAASSGNGVAAAGGASGGVSSSNGAASTAAGASKAEAGASDDSDSESRSLSPTPITGSALDRDYILGVYYSSQFGGGSGSLKAAPIDTTTGQFLDEERIVPVPRKDKDSFILALNGLVEQFKWKGLIGVGFPGLLYANAVNKEEELTPQEIGIKRMQNRLKFQTELAAKLSRGLSLMSGSEANGYGEMLFGAGRGKQGLVMMCTMGKGLGVSMFDDGIIVRNFDVSEFVENWRADMYSEAELPAVVNSGETEFCSLDNGAWVRWAERAESYLQRLDAAFNPDLILVGGAAAQCFDKWAPLISGIKAPMTVGALGASAGVIGAAAGGRIQIDYMDTVARMRAAIGRTKGVSPQLLSEADLKQLFNQIDTNESGTVDAEELATAVSALGINVPVRDLRKMIGELGGGVGNGSRDGEGEVNITFPVFAAWWSSIVTSSPVTYLHTRQEFEGILDEEATSGRLVVMEVGFTWCRPCRAFERTYKEFARQYKQGRFLRTNGNENSDMVSLGRDVLQIKSSPTFIFFRNGKEVHRHTGANAEKFRTAIDEYINPPAGSSSSSPSSSSSTSSSPVPAYAETPEAAPAKAQ